ncbi:MAG: hypothetical protein JOZ69_20605 [Myxococcales bacterium]|nr:hypothetical protein [Myxococcales bacterium]
MRAKAVTWVLAATMAPGCGLPMMGLAQPDTQPDSDSSSPTPDDAGPGTDSVWPPTWDGSGTADAGAPESGGDPTASDAGGDGDAIWTEGGPVDAPSGDASDDGFTARPVLVQKASVAIPNDVLSSVNVPLPQPQLAGDLLVVVVGWNDSSALVGAVSDDAGDDFALATDPTVYPGWLSQSIYYAKNVQSAPNNAITIQFDSPAKDPDIRVLEYRGLDPLDPLDVGTGAQGRGTSMTVGPITTSAPGLLVTASTVQTVTGQPGPEWTVRFITYPNGDLAADRYAATPGSYTGRAPLTMSGQWVMQLAAFRTR